MALVKVGDEERQADRGEGRIDGGHVGAARQGEVQRAEVDHLGHLALRAQGAGREALHLHAALGGLLHIILERIGHHAADRILHGVVAELELVGLLGQSAAAADQKNHQHEGHEPDDVLFHCILSFSFDFNKLFDSIR